MIVRWPGKTETGSKTARLANSGCNAAPSANGSAFAPAAAT
jgi:hypothetical protein